jgi:hypothetical protein
MRLASTQNKPCGAPKYVVLKLRTYCSPLRSPRLHPAAQPIGVLAVVKHGVQGVKRRATGATCCVSASAARYEPVVCHDLTVPFFCSLSLHFIPSPISALPLPVVGGSGRRRAGSAPWRNKTTGGVERGSTLVGAEASSRPGGVCVCFFSPYSRRFPWEGWLPCDRPRLVWRRFLHRFRRFGRHNPC